MNVEIGTALCEIYLVVLDDESQHFLTLHYDNDKVNAVELDQQPITLDEYKGLKITSRRLFSLLHNPPEGSSDADVVITDSHETYRRASET